MTAYAITRECKTRHGEQSPSDDAVKRYLSGKCSLNSRYVSMICGVLNLELRPTKPTRKRVEMTVANLLRQKPTATVRDVHTGAQFSVAEVSKMVAGLMQSGENPAEFAKRFELV